MCLSSNCIKYNRIHIYIITRILLQFFPIPYVLQGFASCKCLLLMKLSPNFTQTQVWYVCTCFWHIPKLMGAHTSLSSGQAQVSIVSHCKTIHSTPLHIYQQSPGGRQLQAAYICRVVMEHTHSVQVLYPECELIQSVSSFT